MQNQSAARSRARRAASFAAGEWLRPAASPRFRSCHRVTVGCVAALALGLAAGSAFAAGSALGPCVGTSDKPQSKLWYNDGFYWAVLQTEDGSHIYKLSGGTWTQQGFVGSETNHGVDGHEDVLWNGTELFVLTYASKPQLHAFTYDTALHTYNLEAGFPVSFSIAGGCETIVLDQDSTGRLWAAYEGGGNIYAAYTTSADHRTWQSPGVILRSGVGDDDVAAVVRFGGNKVGVFWSDQNRWEFGFRVHADGDAAEAWGSTEVIYAGDGQSDDHLNLAADRQGRVYAITKDAHDLFAVHRRDADGHWTTKEDISSGQTGTRPVLMLDATETKLYALYTCWSCSGSDPIVYRTGSTSTLSFGSSSTYISTSSQSLNDVTDMKQILPPSSFIAIASGASTAYWNGSGSPPAGNGFGSSTPPPPPPPPPPAQPPGPPAAVAALPAVCHPEAGIVASFPCDEPAGERLLNDAATALHGTLGASGTDTGEPTRIAGVSGGALHFDGANDYVEVPASPQLDFTGSFTLEAWVRRTAIGSPDVVVAKEGSGRNYRFRLSSSDQVELSWKTASGTSRTTTGSRRVSDTAWHHLAAVHDQERGEDRLYVDGVLDVRRSDTARPGACTDPLLLGARRSSGISDPLKGDLDLVRLASGVLYGSDFVPAARNSTAPALPYVILTWSAPTTGGTPTAYQVYRGTNAEEDLLVTPSAVISPNWIDLLPVDGVLAYSVTAANDQGTSAKSVPVTITFGTGPQPPEAPPLPVVRVMHRDEPLAGKAIYGLDEGQGSTSADGTSGGHTLTLGSSALGDAAEPAWVTGFAGSALRFDGVDDHASTPDEATLRMEASFTVEAWVHCLAAGRYGVLVAKESTSGGRNYRLAVTAANKLELQWKNAAGATNTVTSSGVLDTAAWHHVAGVFDAATGENRLYLDGKASGKAAAAGTPQPGAAALRLGARQSSSVKDFFSGELDLVRVTPAALYAAEFEPPAAYAPRHVVEHSVQWNAAEAGSARLVGYRVVSQRGRWRVDGPHARAARGPAVQHR